MGPKCNHTCLSRREAEEDMTQTHVGEKEAMWPGGRDWGDVAARSGKGKEQIFPWSP